MKKTFSILIFLTILLIISPFISVYAQEEIPFPIKIDDKGFRAAFAETGDLYISGQPDSTSFSMLKNKGVTTVINLRTSSEMDNREYVPFDEKKLVESLGMKYVHIPLGGKETPYSPKGLKAFAKAYNKAKGKVLLHCTVAWRASHVFAAYLIQYKNFEPDKAITYAKAVNFGELPLEGLLGKSLHIEFK